MKNPDFIMYSVSVSPITLVDIRRKFYFVQYYSPAIYDSLSRYEEIRRVKIEDDNTLIHETMYDFKIPEYQDTYYTVSAGEVGRLDTVSLINYDTSTYWWVIAMANDIIDPINEVTEGTVLRIPSIMALYQADGMFGGV